MLKKKPKQVWFLIVVNCALTTGEIVRLGIYTSLYENYEVTLEDALYFIERQTSVKEFNKERYIMTNQIVSVELDGYEKE